MFFSNVLFRPVLYFSYYLFVFLYFKRVGAEYVVRSELIEVEGPGLYPDKIVLPARYFIVYAFGKNFSGSRILTEGDIDVKIKGLSDKPCRIWTNILNRKDSSFIVRYKLYETCQDVEISIKVKGVTPRNFPMVIKGPIYSEDCYCPERNFAKWLHHYGCHESYEQIKVDLKQFLNVNFDKDHEAIVRKFNQTHSSSVCNYVIKNNEVYRRCYGEHQGFKMFMDAIFLSLARKVHLPDFEVFTNLGDWPLVPKGESIPMFSWCGSKNTADIVMPTYDITESTLQTMGRVSLDMLSVQGNIEKPWHEKELKLFWRGRDSSRERLKLIKIGREHPELFNVSLTNFFFFREQEHIYGPKEKHVSFFKFFNYKYQLNVDGTVASYRFPYLLVGDAVVLKQDSEYYEHFYREVEPWKHYIPVKRDLSDLVDRVKWAHEHDSRALLISKEGARYARSRLLPQDIFCYHAHLFYDWSKLMVSPIKIREGMEHVSQPEHDCHCSHKQSREFHKVTRDEL